MDTPREKRFSDSGREPTKDGATRDRIAFTWAGDANGPRAPRAGPKLLLTRPQDIDTSEIESQHSITFAVVVGAIPSVGAGNSKALAPDCFGQRFGSAFCGAYAEASAHARGANRERI